MSSGYPSYPFVTFPKWGVSIEDDVLDFVSSEDACAYIDHLGSLKYFYRDFERPCAVEHRRIQSFHLMGMLDDTHVTILSGEKLLTFEFGSPEEPGLAFCKLDTLWGPDYAQQENTLKIITCHSFSCPSRSLLLAYRDQKNLTHILRLRFSSRRDKAGVVEERQSIGLYSAECLSLGMPDDTGHTGSSPSALFFTTAHELHKCEYGDFGASSTGSSTLTLGGRRRGVGRRGHRLQMLFKLDGTIAAAAYGRSCVAMIVNKTRSSRRSAPAASAAPAASSEEEGEVVPGSGSRVRSRVVSESATATEAVPMCYVFETRRSKMTQVRMPASVLLPMIKRAFFWGGYSTLQNQGQDQGDEQDEYLFVVSESEERQRRQLIAVHLRYLYVGFKLKVDKKSLIVSSSGTFLKKYDTAKRRMSRRLSLVAPTASGAVAGSPASPSKGARGGVGDFSVTFQLHCLRPVTLRKKIGVLVQREQFPFCIRLIEESGRLENFEDELSQILRQYCTYLYRSHQFEKCVKAYLYNPPLESSRLLIPPAYVIKRFSGNKRVLITYLVELHREGLALLDHTTILMEVFIKQIQKRELSEEDLRLVFLDQILPSYFQLEIIRLLRLNGFRHLALEETHKDPQRSIRLDELELRERLARLCEWKVLIEMKDFRGCRRLDGATCTRCFERTLLHIESQELGDARRLMLAHGRELLDVLPKKTTNVIIRLCSDYRPLAYARRDRRVLCLASSGRRREEVVADSDLTDLITTSGYSFLRLYAPREHRRSGGTGRSEATSAQLVRKFVLLYHNKSRFWLMVLLEWLLFGSPEFRVLGRDDKFQFYTLLVELYLEMREKLHGEDKLRDFHPYEDPEATKMILVAAADVEEEEEGETVPKAAAAASEGADIHKCEELTYMQESLNELLPEMDYSISAPRTYLATSSYAEKIRHIVRDIGIADFSRLLSVVSVKYASEVELRVLLMSKLGMGSAILQLYRDEKNYARVMKESMKILRRKMGKNRSRRGTPAEPDSKEEQFWVGLLVYYCNECKRDNPRREEAEKYLREILDMHRIGPLRALAVLKTNPEITVGFLRDFVVEFLQKQQAQAQEDEQKVAILRERTAELVEKNRDFAEKFRLFNDRSGPPEGSSDDRRKSGFCSQCERRLHFDYYCFMCGHMFHQDCLENGFEECQICAEGAAGNRGKLKRLIAYRESGKKRERFTETVSFRTVSNYLGKGIFEDFPV